MKTSILAVALALAFSGTASAEDAMPDIHVSYADLDLGSPTGVKALDRRLGRAIRSACRQDGGAADLESKTRYRRCLAARRADVASHRDRVLAKASGAGAAQPSSL